MHSALTKQSMFSPASQANADNAADQFVADFNEFLEFKKFQELKKMRMGEQLAALSSGELTASKVPSGFALDPEQKLRSLGEVYPGANPERTGSKPAPKGKEGAVEGSKSRLEETGSTPFKDRKMREKLA